MSNIHNQEEKLSPDQEQEQLGLRLKEAREYLGLSQEYVAERLGVPRASISAMETSKRKVSSLELKQLAKLYKQPVSFFYGEAEPQKDEALQALFRTTKDLNAEDRKQVLRFAQFLRNSGPAPKRGDGETTSNQT